MMSNTSQLKQGNVYTFQVPQNSASYIVRIALLAKGLWICVQQSYMEWKLTINQQLLIQTVTKATLGKQQIGYKQFIYAVVAALKKQGDKWTIGIMTPIQLEMLRGGNASKQTSNNKLYLILSEKNKKLHLPFTLVLNDSCVKDKMIQAIRTMKDQLDDLRTNADKSQSSFSILSQSAMAGDQLKIQNQQLKKKIKIYQQSLTQKRGAVQIDNILRQKNNLELKAQNKKREEIKQITRLKNIHQMMERQINQLRNQADLITHQLMMLEDNIGNPAKLKNHAMRVLKSYETDLRNSKKLLVKQTKQIETIKRNLQTSKNNQKKNYAKIKQIQQEIEQAKKKANIKQISNRLHSPGNSRNGSSNGGSLKAPSQASDSSVKRAGLNNKLQTNNLVRQNLLNRTSQNKVQRQRSLSNTAKNQLLKTTPNIKSPSIPRKTQYKPPVRPVVSSHVLNNNQYSRNSPVRQRSKENDMNSNKSSSAQIKKREYSPAQRQKQKAAMDRLTGGNRNQVSSKPPIANSSSNKNIAKPITSVNRTAGSMPKKDNAKDILNRMKQVKAQYNNRSKNSAVKQQGMAAKIAELTSKNQNK